MLAYVSIETYLCSNIERYDD